MLLQSMFVLATVNFIDAISYMSVAPSLIFYVRDLGGTKEQYGLIMSAFSLASFLSKPFYGLWVDKSNNKFRSPYIASLIIAIIGGLLYFFASWFEDYDDPRVGISMIFIGRVCSGIGAGNNAIGYAYLALTVPFEKQTQTNSLLSMTRIVGMAVGPAVNLLLGEINFNVTLFGKPFHIDPLNSVGLLLAIANVLTLIVLLLLLKEPEEHEIAKHPNDDDGLLDGDKPNKNKRMRRLSTQERRTIWHALFCIEIILPVLIIFIVNSCFQLVETALAPAAADSLGFGPIETSAILSASTGVIFLGMIFVMVMSKHIKDIVMVAIGACFWIVGGAWMYFGWARYVPLWHFVGPVMVAVAGFPFIAASNRSSFSKSVASKPELESMQASMQAVLSMAASVAGFVTPGFVAAYVVRSPEEVDEAGDDREMTPVALYCPILSSFILVGLFILWRKQKAEEAEHIHPDDGEGTLATEQTPLVVAGVPRQRGSSNSRASIVAIETTFSRQGEVARRCSAVMAGGLLAPDTYEEKEERKHMMEDWEAMKELHELDAAHDSVDERP